MTRTKEWVESCIKYEEHKGVHTYHQCRCGRMRTRAGKCVLCLKEELKEVSSEEKN